MTQDERFAAHEARCRALGFRYQVRDIAHFSSTPDVLEKLLEDGYADPNDRQNDAPTYSELVEFAKTVPGSRLLGYVVTPTRPDCRITIEEIQIPKDSDRDACVKFAVFAHGSDEFDGFRAWWD